MIIRKKNGKANSVYNNIIVKRRSSQSCIPGNLFFFFWHMEVMLMVSKLTIAFCCSVVSLKLTCKYHLNFDNNKYLFRKRLELKGELLANFSH